MISVGRLQDRYDALLIDCTRYKELVVKDLFSKLQKVVLIGITAIPFFWASTPIFWAPRLPYMEPFAFQLHINGQSGRRLGPLPIASMFN